MRRRSRRGIPESGIDLLVLAQRISGIDDNSVRKVNALEHFQGIAKFPPDSQFFESDSAIESDDGAL